MIYGERPLNVFTVLVHVASHGLAYMAYSTVLYLKFRIFHLGDTLLRQIPMRICSLLSLHQVSPVQQQFDYLHMADVENI